MLVMTMVPTITHTDTYEDDIKEIKREAIF